VIIYLVAAAALVYAACNSQNNEGPKKEPPKPDPKLNLDPKFKPQWMVSQNALFPQEKDYPAFPVYPLLREAGVNNLQIDRDSNGEITEEELHQTALDLFQRNPQNEKYRRIVEVGFKEVANRYYNYAAASYGRHALRHLNNCGSYIAEGTKKALFYDPNHISSIRLLDECAKYGTYSDYRAYIYPKDRRSSYAEQRGLRNEHRREVFQFYKRILQGKGQDEQIRAQLIKEKDPTLMKIKALHEIEEGIVSIRKAIQRDPKDATAHINLAKELVKLIKILKDLDYLLYDRTQEIPIFHKEAMDALNNKAIELAPKGSAAYLEIAKACEDIGTKDALRLAFKLNPTDSSLSNFRNLRPVEYKDFSKMVLKSAEDYIDLAVSKYNYSSSSPVESQKLIPYFQKAAEIDPSYVPLAEYMKAHLRIKIEKYLTAQRETEEEIVSIRKAIQRDPKNATANINLAKELIKLSKILNILEPTNKEKMTAFHKEAMAALNKATKGSITNPKEIGNVFFELGHALSDKNEAMVALHNALKFNPRGSLFLSHFTIQLSEKYEKVNFSKMVPKTADDYIDLSILILENKQASLNELKKGILYVQKAAKIDPSYKPLAEDLKYKIESRLENIPE
jgi:hypothetical protein